MTSVDKLRELLTSEQLTTTKLADDSGVVLDVDSLQVLALNETGMFLIEALQHGAESENDLVERLVTEFEVETETAANDVKSFLDEMGDVLLDRKKR
jgi:hypothetical protein